MTKTVFKKTGISIIVTVKGFTVRNSAGMVVIDGSLIDEDGEVTVRERMLTEVPTTTFSTVIS
jgi:hypothetical protein